MENILIATDSTSTFTIEEAKEKGIALLSLSVIVDGNEFKDLVEISAQEVYENDKNGCDLTTSQPNLGYLLAEMKGWKEKNYKHIIVITLSNTFSGTFQAVRMMAKELEMDNITIVDSLLVGSPMKEASLQALEMVKEGKSVEKIVANCARIFGDTTTFVFPLTLDNLRKGGRITGATAAMSSLLRIKPLLYFQNQDGVIEKHSVHRTEASVFKAIINDYKEKGVQKETYKLNLLHAQGKDIIDRFVKVIDESFPGIEYEILDLPAVLTTHTGVGTFAVQSVLKRD